jgi:hypothetical protein
MTPEDSVLQSSFADSSLLELFIATINLSQYRRLGQAVRHEDTIARRYGSPRAAEQREGLDV